MVYRVKRIKHKTKANHKFRYGTVHTQSSVCKQRREEKRGSEREREREGGRERERERERGRRNGWKEEQLRERGTNRRKGIKIE